MTSDEEIKQKYFEICDKYKIRGTITEFCNEINNYLLLLKEGSPLAEIIYKEFESGYIHYRNKGLHDTPAKKFIEELEKKVTKKSEGSVKN